MSALQFLQRIGAINLPEDVLNAVFPPERPSYESARAQVLEFIKQLITSAEIEITHLRARLEDERIRLDPNEVERITKRIADLASYRTSRMSELSDENELERKTLKEMGRQMSEQKMGEQQMSKQQEMVNQGILAAARAMRRLMLAPEQQAGRPLVPSESHAQLVNEIAVMIDKLVDDAVTRRLAEITDRTN